MKKIEAIIRVEKFDDVCEVLEESGIGGLTVLEAKGFGKHRNGLADKIKIEIYSDESTVEKIVDMIRRVAKTGTTGDGKIAVLPLDDIYKIRTEDSGASAI